MPETIASIMRKKNGEIWSITPDATVYDALALMADKDVGALLVISGGELVGIISERDYARKVVLHGKFSRDTLVRDIMSTALVTVTPGHSVEDCMLQMTLHRVRHLPVVDRGNVAGVISIGDLVNSIISSQAQTIAQLHTYIRGSYPA